MHPTTHADRTPCVKNPGGEPQREQAPGLRRADSPLPHVTALAWLAGRGTGWRRAGQGVGLAAPDDEQQQRDDGQHDEDGLEHQASRQGLGVRA